MLSRIIQNLEESLIALILGVMVLLTFANVIARYVFQDNILWALELCVYLFAWLVLLGASYGVKHNLHIGVDIVLGLLGANWQKMLALFAIIVSLIYAMFMLVGAWEYWEPFVSKRAWLEVDDIPMPDLLRFLETWLNEGEAYEKIPRFIPYAILPLSMFLLCVRLVEGFWHVYQGHKKHIIAAHEGEHEANHGEG